MNGAGGLETEAEEEAEGASGGAEEIAAVVEVSHPSEAVAGGSMALGEGEEALEDSGGDAVAGEAAEGEEEGGKGAGEGAASEVEAGGGSGGRGEGGVEGFSHHSGILTIRADNRHQFQS